MTKILSVRHGHVEGIDPERFRGRADLPLTEQGKGKRVRWPSGLRPIGAPPGSIQVLYRDVSKPPKPLPKRAISHPKP